MTSSEFRNDFIGGIHSPRDTGSVRQNDTAAKVRRQTVQKIQMLRDFDTDVLHGGKFSIEVEIFGKCRADIDNVLKGVLDALNGVAYIDDKQCVEARVKLYQG